MSRILLPTLPRAFDPEAAARLAERFAERDAACRAFAASADGAALLGALGGHSPYLADLAVRKPCPAPLAGTWTGGGLRCGSGAARPG
ncbi:hypothetical protein ACFQY5_07980 [Paeniroseomonas aquatica]|uniref:hypothetical protein n=1 Tax=Paeniroseomonas aquatica TaxID=373043 RepID=UPI00360A4131